MTRAYKHDAQASESKCLDEVKIDLTQSRRVRRGKNSALSAALRDSYFLKDSYFRAAWHCVAKEIRQD